MFCGEMSVPSASSQPPVTYTQVESPADDLALLKYSGKSIREIASSNPDRKPQSLQENTGKVP
jgi:hypothetical protein